MKRVTVIRLMTKVAVNGNQILHLKGRKKPSGHNSQRNNEKYVTMWNMKGFFFLFISRDQEDGVFA